MPEEKPTTPPEAESLDSQEIPAPGDLPNSVETATTTGPPTKTKNQNPEKVTLIKKITGFRYLYFIVFILLILVAGAIVFLAFTWGQRQVNDQTTDPQSLTDEQLAELSGNSILIGDPKQTLAIQGNTVFEGQVLARSDLTIAGALKVGGSLSLPSIDVGDGSFDQLQVDNNLAIGGDISVDGQISLQGGLTVGGETSFTNLSVGQLSVTGLNLSGDLNIRRHIVASGGTPTKSNGSALGGGGSASVSGSDTAGTVNINTGSSPSAGCFITVTFANNFSGTPSVVLSPSNSSAGGLQYYTNRTSTGFSVCTANSPTASSTYIFDYVVIN